MSEFAIKSFDTLVANMAAYIVAHAPQISDLNAGSVLRAIVEGLSLGLEEVYTTGYLGFQRELAVMKQNIFNFTKLAGTTANCQVAFTGPTAPVGGTPIAAGTHVRTATGLIFTTDTIATIAAGQTVSNTVAVTAEEIGTAYNVGAGEISIMGDSVIGVNSVTNANAATGGTDEESDYAYEQRFQLYIEGLGVANIAGVEYAARSYPGITSSSYLELVPPQAGVDALVYVDDGTLSGVSAATLAAIQAIIDGDGTKANPGYRALGINTVVTAPAIVTQNIAVTIFIDSGTGVDATNVVTNVNTVISAYVNGLSIGASLVKSKLIDVIMEVYGVYDCIVTLPAANVVATKGQVIRAGTITISVG